MEAPNISNTRWGWPIPHCSDLAFIHPNAILGNDVAKEFNFL